MTEHRPEAEQGLDLALPGSTTSTSLTLPTDLPYEAWAEIGSRLGRLSGAVMWWVGDWLNYADNAYPGRDNYSRAMAATGFSRDTVWNAAWVCRRFAPEDRRSDVQYAHHQVLAARTRDEQVDWLARSQANGWGHKRLRQEVERSAMALAMGDASGALEPGEPAFEDPRHKGLEHRRIQHALLKLGVLLGYDVWPARNDKTRRWGGSTFDKLFPLIQNLPRLVPGNSHVQGVVELIDVLWLRGGTFVAAFEIEHTTQVFSGLLRMSDLLALAPNLTIPLYVVSPMEKLTKVIREVNRPTFANMGLNKKCRVITFELLIEEMEQPGERLRSLDGAKYLDYLSRPCDPTGESIVDE